MSPSQMVGSYACSGCGREVARDTVRCPACNALLSGVRCKSCNYVGPVDEFDDNNDRCPRCFPPPPRRPGVIYPSDIRNFERRGDVDSLIAALDVSFSSDDYPLSMAERLGLETPRNRLDFRDVEVQAAAAKALLRLGGREAAKALLVVKRLPASSLRDLAITAFIEDLESTNADVRRKAVRILGEFVGKRAVGPLISVLEDKSSKVREDAIVALGELGARSALTGIAGRLMDSSPQVRLAAARTLGKLGGPLAVTALADARAGADEGLRDAIIEALGKIGSPALTALTQVLEDDSPSVRLAVVEALAHLGRPAAKALTLALKDDDPKVRSRATQALVKSGSATTDTLKQVLEDGNSEQRLAAAVALGKSGSRAGVATLVEALKDGRPEKRYKAAIALGGLGDHAAVGTLCDALAEADAKTRQTAAEMLGRLGDPASAEALGRALECPDTHGAEIRDERDRIWADQDVRAEVTAALAKVGGPAALAAATRVLDNTFATSARKQRRYLARRGAISVLEGLGAGAEGPLLRAMQDSDPELCIAAAKALGGLGNPSAVPYLIKAFKKSKRREDQIAAAEALADLGAQSARPHLLKATKKEYYDEYLWRALLKLGSPEALTRYTDHLTNLEFFPDHRASIASSLGEVGPVALEVLSLGLNDDEPQVRRAAVEALGHLGSAARGPLESALSDPNPKVRESAAKALRELGSS